MQRYFIKEKYEEPEISLTGEIYHHLKNVMRQKVGDKFYLVDTTHVTYLMEITAINETITAKSLQKIPENKEFPVDITIACGFPKGEKLEFIAQKTTELGAKKVVAFPVASSVVRWDEKKLTKKKGRLEKIVQEAAEQSHRIVIPEISLIGNYSVFLDTLKEYDFIFIAYEEESKIGEKAQLKKLFSKVPKGSSVLAIFGPEGGFTKKEVEEMVALGGVKGALGPRILRAETAPLYFLSAASFFFELGD